MNATVKEVQYDCVEIAWNRQRKPKIAFTGPIKMLLTMKYQLVGDTKSAALS